MKPDPILEELWATKERLAREAGYDAHCFVEKLREWEAEHSQAGMAVSTAAKTEQRTAEKDHGA